MSRAGFFLFLFLVGAPHPGVAQLKKTTTQKLDQFLTQQVQNKSVPGVAVFVTDRRQMLYQQAAGSAGEDRPLQTDALFSIYSMTKAVTAIALMQLVEQGKVKLREPVRNYLPVFDQLVVLNVFNPGDSSWQTVPLQQPVTIHHLLTHTSGLSYDFVSAPIAAIKAKKGSQTGPIYTRYPLLFQPGTRWQYGTNLEAIGEIIEKVSGKTLDKYFDEHIFQPLGMKETFFSVPETEKKRLVDMHTRNTQGFSRSRNVSHQKQPVHGGYGLVSSGADFSRLLQCLLNEGTLNGHRIISPSSVRTMSSNQIGNLRALPLKSSNNFLTRDFPETTRHFQFGYGVIITEDAVPGQRSKGSYGWAGILNTFFWVDPSRGIAVTVMMQQLPFFDAQALATLEGIEKILYE